MCLVCNVPVDSAAAHSFLYENDMARIHMRKAADAMLECSKAATDPADRKRYDRTYKKMARIIREWNSVEHERELTTIAPAPLYTLSNKS